MQTIPSLKELKAYAADKTYTVAPVATTILSDFITPIEALKILKATSTHCYMLESVAGDERRGRYTFLGLEPQTEVTLIGGKMTVDGRTFETNEPAVHLRKLLAEYRAPRIAGLPPFTGGLVGYFSYDYFGYIEPTVRTKTQDDEAFKDLDLMLFDKVIAFDNYRQQIVLIVNVRLSELDAAFPAAVNELERLKALLLSERRKDEGGRLLGKPKPLFDRETYKRMVEAAKRHIYEGDIFQVVLSNRLSAPFEGSLLDTYRLLRTRNPSPYMFYFSGTDVEIAGASPETLVKLENGVLYTYPLAGTRPRGKTEEEDLRLEKELLSDEKELAEHNMLVDLGRNDLGKLAAFGTVEVSKLRQIERYSHVMHIGSCVRAKIKPECDALDAIAAVLPAGTLSGAPKIRACQLIDALENNKRGVYGGAIGYIDFTGNADTCIAIRIAYKKNGKVFVRSGAGIVADSDPDKEYDECINKARAVVEALEIAEEGL